MLDEKRPIFIDTFSKYKNSVEIDSSAKSQNTHRYINSLFRIMVITLKNKIHYTAENKD